MLSFMLFETVGSISNLTEQLATLGIHLPGWPEEPEGDTDTGDWIERGKTYAEGVQVWRAQLRNAPESTRVVVDQLLRHLRDTGQLGVWDQMVYYAIKPEVQGSPEHERWQACTKLIRSPALTPAQTLGMTLEMAREQRLLAAIYGLKRLLKEHQGIGPKQRLQLCAEVVATSDTSRVITNAESAWVDWNRAVGLQEQMSGLLLAALAADQEGDPDQGSQITDSTTLLSKLDAINNWLGSKGTHGHGIFIQVCREKLPKLLQVWSGERPWILEVGCSREIIEGQSSTGQLLALANDLDLPFAGIDLDKENIEALARDHRESNAIWITGKGEKVLQTWEKPVLACYLDAYDYWHTSHSEIRMNTYIENYGKPINDAECHRMHLEAGRHVSQHICTGGIIGIDDTWRNNGTWSGKGSLAVPWLTKKEWQITSETNKAVIMQKISIEHE
ncbi:hypothetical protein MY494_07380 [Synechococcus sp. A10-1-5-1]|uniref:hypothetical protein n=1 Tax=Synechococcus sp. A10-1-5-1 TaxID=2936507 RepID=UPI002001611B|nr:hypothetical protein [Synechococcus sp. A10-1-5-1]UPM49175.1 hypothetical protein MY494_07380 [Synechococcus sp. A10-1-5-1]